MTLDSQVEKLKNEKRGARKRAYKVYQTSLLAADYNSLNEQWS